jgi:hypothetical protein
MTSKVEAWLARLSDPAGPNPMWSPQPFSQAEAALLPSLVEAAGLHNVRPPVVRNLGVQLRVAPQEFMTGDPANVRAATGALTARANDLRLQDVARAVLLAAAAREILAAVSASALPAVLVKGVDFAENAYGGLHDRTFSDIDLLVRPQAEGALNEILASVGFRAITPRASRLDHTERQWTRRDGHGGVILVEVHTDIVHTPELRARQTLTYDLYADQKAGGVTPAARLVLAALHGATSHLFGRLQYVVDGLMVARMGVDSEELRERAHRSGAALPVATMLRLAAELYGCLASRTLLGALEPIRWNAVERRLITPAMVLSAKDAHRWRLLPQRYTYRCLLRLPNRRA